MKTPLTYYGGKQKMLRFILPNIPNHQVYVEPFIGGGAVFFAKPPTPLEIINDLNGCLITFYKVMQSRFEDLQTLFDATLYSRQEHQTAWIIYNVPHLFDEVYVAWSVMILSSQGFLSEFSETWGTGNIPTSYGKDATVLKFANKKKLLREQALAFKQRLEGVQIEQRDALEIIKLRDSELMFTYCDPPYFNSDMGHYGGYTEAPFRELLNTLANIKGRFLLSSYDSLLLQEKVVEMGWVNLRIERTLDAGITKKTTRNKKIECLTANYPIHLPS